MAWVHAPRFPQWPQKQRSYWAFLPSPHLPFAIPLFLCHPICLWIAPFDLLWHKQLYNQQLCLFVTTGNKGLLSVLYPFSHHPIILFTWVMLLALLPEEWQLCFHFWSRTCRINRECLNPALQMEAFFLSLYHSSGEEAGSILTAGTYVFLWASSKQSVSTLNKTCPIICLPWMRRFVILSLLFSYSFQPACTWGTILTADIVCMCLFMTSAFDRLKFNIVEKISFHRQLHQVPKTTVSCNTTTKGNFCWWRTCYLEP